MKKSVLAVIFAFAASYTFAQSAKYESAMKNNISQLDSVMAKNNYTELADNFTRIGDAEKTQWLPYYYAGYLYAVDALRTEDASAKDGIADKATAMITKAESVLGKENSETALIKAMIATAHMMVDPQTRYSTYGQAIADNMQKSESLDSTNPRPVLFEAQSKYYTPEAYGGGKDVAKPLFEKAKTLYENFKPESDISPNWGRTNVDYFLSQYK